MIPQEETIAELSVTPARRIFGTALLAGLGAVLLWVWLTLPDKSLAATVVFAGAGGLSLWQAQRFYEATGRSLVLTASGLSDSTGQVIAAMEDIALVNRGTFAFKPSNGFMIRLNKPGSGTWVPGVWWRLGTRVGIGGATPGRASRDFADLITLLKTDPETARRLLDLPDA